MDLAKSNTPYELGNIILGRNGNAVMLNVVRCSTYNTFISYYITQT